MKNRPYITGIIAAASPFYMFIFTLFWCWIWFFGIGIGLLNYDTIPPWIQAVSLIPLLVSPAIGICGIIHGLIKIKHKLAWLGIVLSVGCLLENILMFFCMAYLGSRF